MPLLRKQPFQKQKIPQDLDPEEEVFHCKITNEIFRDYNAFFERIILCNSLVWSCAVTGKSGMTFQEAVESEKISKKNLSTFQDSLKKPLLYLATLTQRSRLNDLNDDLFVFCKDRFFIGETLDYVSGSQKLACRVIDVIPPPESTKSNGDVIVIDDSEDSNSTSSETKSQKKKKNSGIDPAKYQYIVRIVGSSDIETVSAVTLCRKKGLYTRDRSKLFLKTHCAPVNGIWKVKDGTMRKLNLGSAKFEDFFAGPAPQFQKSSLKRKSNSKKSIEPVDVEIDLAESPEHSSSKSLKNNKGQRVNTERPVESVSLTPPEDKALMKEKLKQQKIDERKKMLEEKEAKKEEMRRQVEAEKLRRKEEKEKERMKKIEEKKKELELYKEWSKPRDDLECDDLKDMPDFIPVRTRIPSELFGEAVMILEFAHIFKTIFDFKQFFPKGFTWGMIESALVDHEPDGPLCDLLQMLLCALFNLQEEEADEYEEMEKQKDDKVKLNEEKDEDMEEEVSTNEVIRTATIMAQFCQNTLGMPLRDTLLDQFTLSEIVRIHLLSSGAKASHKNARFRYQQRGGYTCHDDPGLELKLTDPGLVKSLATKNVFDLSPCEKAKIINTLIQQILTFAMVRDMIEENGEKLRLKKYDLKQLQWAEQRREREELANRYKRLLEEKNKEQARRMQQLLAEQSGDVPDEKIEILEEKTAEQKELEKLKEEELENEKKLEYSNREYELLMEILDLQMMVYISPIGRDRFYRRYYFFSSLNGLFIEDHELHVPASLRNPESYVKEMKENGTKTSDDCIVISDAESDSSDKKDAKEEMMEITDSTATKDEQADIGNSSSHPVWSFINTAEQLDALIACLNTRGFRECSLRTSLMELKPVLTPLLQNCSTDILCLPEDGGEEKARIQALALTRGISSKKAAQDALIVHKAEVSMELNLRDALLDMEDRIYVGGLGNLKVKNRSAWRDAILNKTYDSQSDDLVLSSAGNDIVNGSETADTESTSHDLAKALAQIARMVEPKYLKEPLNESSGQKGAKSLFERWEESLLASTSLSQIYLHLATLDKSIVWAKSTLETRCKICRRKGDPDKMLLCDECDRGHHMYCLKPPMDTVPSGDWFCSECRPKQSSKSPVRKGRRKTFTEVDEEPSDEEEYYNASEAEEDSDTHNSNGDSNEDGDSTENLEENPEDDLCVHCKTPGMLICCDCCPRAYHLHCAKPVLKKVPKGKWMCQVCMGTDRAGKIKIGSGKLKGSKKKEKDKKAASNVKSTPNGSRPSSRRESPRDSPVLGKPRKHNLSALSGKDTSQLKMKKSKSQSRLSLDSADDQNPMIRLMKPIMPSSKRTNNHQQQMKAAEELVNELIRHDDAWPFLKPVDKKLVPDYYSVIKKPMDLSTIRNKIHAFSYQKPSEMLEDIRQIFYNCVEYNNRNSPEYKAYFRLSKYFDKRVREMSLEDDVSVSKAGRSRVSV